MKLKRRMSGLCVVATVGLFIHPGNVMAVDVDCTSGSALQAAIDAAFPGANFEIIGNCPEDIFIYKDFLTLSGKNNDTEGVNGRVTLNTARGVTLKDMTVNKGSNGREGIRVDNRAELRLDGVTISGHDRAGLLVRENSFARISDSTITANIREGVAVETASLVIVGDFRGDTTKITLNNRDGLRVSQNSTGRIDNIEISGNGRRAIQVTDGSFVRSANSDILSTVPDSADFAGGILVNRGSVLALNGGNTVSNTSLEPGGGTAITVFAGSFLRQGTFGGPASIDGTNRALSVANQGQADLRDFTLTGDVRVGRHSLLRLRKDTTGLVAGNIEVAQDSVVSFALVGSDSVQVTGTVTCLDTESSADFPDQTAADIVGGNGKEMNCSGYGPANSQP